MLANNYRVKIGIVWLWILLILNKRFVSSFNCYSDRLGTLPGSFIVHTAGNAALEVGNCRILGGSLQLLLTGDCNN